MFQLSTACEDGGLQVIFHYIKTLSYVTTSATM
jgi:hypothetical protein